MNRKNKLFLCTTLVFVLSFNVYADTALGGRYLTEANEAYNQKNYEKAYDCINDALQLYGTQPFHDNVVLLAEGVYYAYLGDIHARKDMDAFAQIKDSLAKYPILASNRVTLRIRVLNNIEVQALSMQASMLTETSDHLLVEEEREILRVGQIAELQSIQDSQQKMVDILASQADEFTETITESVKQSEANNSTLLIAIMVISALLVLICVAVVVLVVSNNKNNKKHLEQFEATLQIVAQMNRIPSERIMIGGVTDLYGETIRSAGSSRWGVDALPEPEQTDEEKIELADVAGKCERLGAEVSFVTGRKNNSKNVAELVYKLSIAMGISNTTCMVYFCVAMVYDIGFLEIDNELLQAKNLTDEQKYEVRSHVQKGMQQLDFIPERYQKIFADAAMLHHENLDGSGYPDGLEGEQIPVIARIIRIAETFVALISKRIYRGIMDKESAIEELRRQGPAVDQSIVDVLDSIV